MNEAELAFAGVARQAELVRSKDVSARELIELSLQRIERLDRELNAFRSVYPERAIEEAKSAQRKLRSKQPPPLLGVPVAIKDNFDVAGDVTTHGTSAHGGPAQQDCEVVRRVREAGAIVVGKTHLPELAAMNTTESASFGWTRNPWDTGRTTGGSSGGSAAAVAAGDGADRAGQRRRRLDPDPRGLLRGVRPQAPAGADQPRSPRRALARAQRRRLGDPQRRRLGADARRDGRRDRGRRRSGPATRSAVRGGGRHHSRADCESLTRSPFPPDSSASASTMRSAAALLQTVEVLRSLGHRVEEQDPDYGFAAAAWVPRFLKGAAARRGGAPPSRAAAAAHPRLGALGKVAALVGAGMGAPAGSADPRPGEPGSSSASMS